MNQSRRAGKTVLHARPLDEDGGIEFQKQEGDRVEKYEVERKGDMVSIGLGFVPAFELPQSTAIKLAALILRKAGCGVTVSANCLTASWRKLDG